MWTRALEKARRLRLKDQKKKPSQGKSLLSKKEQSSGSGESAAVRYTQTSLPCIGDKTEMSDNDLAVVRTVEMLTVAESDALGIQQEKEARSSGGISSR